MLLSVARIITTKGDEVIRGDVLVTDNRIAAVGTRGSIKAPAGTQTIDVQGKTIMPGLVAAAQLRRFPASFFPALAATRRRSHTLPAAKAGHRDG